MKNCDSGYTHVTCRRCHKDHPTNSVHMCEWVDLIAAKTPLRCGRCNGMHPAGSIHVCVPMWMEHMNDETPRKPTPLPRQPPEYTKAYPDLQAYPEPAPILPQAPQGWLCPKCHSAHSPQTVTCPQNIFNMQGLK